MKDINDLRRDRSTAAMAMQTAADALASAADGDVKAAQEAFDSAKASFDRSDAAVKAKEQAEAAMAQSAIAETKATQRAPAQAADPALKGAELGFMTIALVNAKGDRERAAQMLEREGYSGISAVMNTATDSQGGVLVPQAMADDMIELLRPRVVVRRAGALSVPMPAGQLRHAQQTGSATAGYGGETSAIVASEPTTDKIDQSFKTLTALVPVSNALLIFGPRTAALVRDDLIAVLAAREDLGFLRDAGTGDLVKGMWHWMPAGHKQADVANSFAAVDASLRKMVSKVTDSNVLMTKGGWVMRGAVKEFLASLRNELGMQLYPSVDATGTLLGYPIYTTSQIPNNLGTGGNESEIMFADFAELMIGDASQLIIEASTQAAYLVGEVVHSAFQENKTLVKAVSRHDFAPRHDVAIAGARVVNWAL